MIKVSINRHTTPQGVSAFLNRFESRKPQELEVSGLTREIMEDMAALRWKVQSYPGTPKRVYGR